MLDVKTKSESEIAKSPKDRLLRMSRESIRKEIALFAALTPNLNVQADKKNFSYIGMNNFMINGIAGSKNTLVDKLNKIKERKKSILEIKKDKPALINRAEKLEEKRRFSLVDKRKEETKKAIIELINNARELQNNYKYK